MSSSSQGRLNFGQSTTSSFGRPSKLTQKDIDARLNDPVQFYKIDHMRMTPIPSPDGTYFKTFQDPSNHSNGASRSVRKTPTELTRWSQQQVCVSVPISQYAVDIAASSASGVNFH